MLDKKKPIFKRVKYIKQLLRDIKNNKIEIMKKLSIDTKAQITLDARNKIQELRKTCYTEGATNTMEGDYGSWHDWEDVLIEFSNEMIKKHCK